MNCMWELLFDNHSFTCNNCPIKKYNCCGLSDRDFDELISRLRLDKQKIDVILNRVLEKRGM